MKGSIVEGTLTESVKIAVILQQQLREAYHKVYIVLSYETVLIIELFGLAFGADWHAA
jgi:hypothetical protein